MSKVILVTGASSGLGRAIADELACNGHRVYGTCRQPSDNSGKFTMLPLDVTLDNSVAQCVAAVIASAGRIDVLINNAGFGLCGAIEDTAPHEARQQMETNFWGPLRIIQAVLPHMRRQGSGRLITIGSMAGHAALPYQPFYSTSKFALEGLNEALRLELAGSGIDATMVCPGDFKTGFDSARVFAAAARNGRHADQLAKTTGLYIRDERAGADPAIVAKLIAQLVVAPRLDVRYFAGRPLQKLGMLLKRVLPANWFERLMKITYAIR
jgi:NAD(P)-dependent dehydrogenase (short-subunit alcohol dehydrogenase family)